ncbi:MAG: NUDIX hydrolase [Deltaproteobacteria bacterium]|nr:NUDIX hydrolase [Deltaproteobacteria bacterium]
MNNRGMHRTWLLEKLKQVPKTPIQQDFVSFVQEHPQCFERDFYPGHVTGSALIVNENHSKVLLMHHKKLHLWLQPGGHADGSGLIHDVALRESQEECGAQHLSFIRDGIFDLDIHTIPENHLEPSHKHYDVRFILKVNKLSDIRKNDESYALKWFVPEELMEIKTDASVVRLVAKAVTSKLLLIPQKL